MILRRQPVVEAALVMVVVAAGVALRVHYLDAAPFWVDEAESSINALTILEHGYPTDTYLAIPIFENTLVKPRPGDPEYEFKDISYSDRGMATYHGWLPLYSIAASFALHGIQPDRAGDGAPARRDLAELKRRTRAARMPSVVFGALFIACCYLGGTLMYGRDAGVTALLAAAAMTFHVETSIQARYYSAVVTLSTGALIMLWLIWKRGRLRHYVGGAIVFLLLFLTHLVTFAAGVLVLAAMLPAMYFRHDRFLIKLGVFGAILTAGASAWLIATGFLSGLGVIPAARAYLHLPGDFLTYPIAKVTHTAIVIVFLLLIGAAYRRWGQLPERIAKPLRESAGPVYMTALWIVAAYGAFFFLIPAVSFDFSRMKYPYWGPALLLGSIFCAVIGRMIAPRFSVLIAPVAACVLAAATGVSLLGRPHLARSWDGITRIEQYVQQSGVTARSKLYAFPNSHLILTFYTGLPFQTIYPIRKSFLDTYPGDIYYFDLDEFGLESRNRNLAPERLRAAAARAGEVLDDADARELSRKLRTLEYRRAMLQRIGGDQAAAEAAPRFAEQLIEAERSKADVLFAEMVARTPILRGYRITNWREWVGVLMYRFVGPEARMGPALNYAERLRGSEADILSDTGWVIYRSSYSRPRDAAVRYRLLP